MEAHECLHSTECGDTMGHRCSPFSGGAAGDLIFLREIKIFIVFDERIAAVCAYYV